MNNIVRFLKDEDGTTKIEYVLTATLIVIAALVAIRSLGTKMGTGMGNISTQLR